MQLVLGLHPHPPIPSSLVSEETLHSDHCALVAKFDMNWHIEDAIHWPAYLQSGDHTEGVSMFRGYILVQFHPEWLKMRTVVRVATKWTNQVKDNHAGIQGGSRLGDCDDGSRPGADGQGGSKPGVQVYRHCIAECMQRRVVFPWEHLQFPLKDGL